MPYNAEGEYDEYGSYNYDGELESEYLVVKKTRMRQKKHCQSVSMMHRDDAGVLYYDWMGSMLEVDGQDAEGNKTGFSPEGDSAFPEGQWVMSTAMGVRLRLYRVKSAEPKKEAEAPAGEEEAPTKEAVAPEGGMPKMPEMSMPEMSMPEMSMPEMPEMKMPEMKMPEMPEMSMPEMSMPKMPEPSMPDMPDIDWDQIGSKEDDHDPLYADEPFSESLKITDIMSVPAIVLFTIIPLCWPILIVGLMSDTRIRGIPKGSKKLSDTETKEVMDKLQGVWKIQLLPGAPEAPPSQVEGAKTTMENFNVCVVKGTYIYFQGDAYEEAYAEYVEQEERDDGDGY